MAVIHFSKEGFDKAVAQGSPMLVDFWASWCGPCKMLSPVVEELAQAHPEVSFCKVNVDECPELAVGYRISAIPALMLFKDGKLAGNSVGFQPREAIEAMLK